VSASVITVEDQAVKAGSVFTVNVTLAPSEPVKAWEFRMIYNTSLLNLVEIDEGRFFHGYQTFYVSNGSVAYDLILGHGNVTSPGCIATAVFQAKATGTTSIGLAGAGVTNETMYLPLKIVNGTVTVGTVKTTPPQVHHGDDVWGGLVAAVVTIGFTLYVFLRVVMKK